MREGWEIRRLEEVCELSAGGDVPKRDFSKFKTKKHKVPIFANGEKNDGLYGYTSIAKITKPSITVSARGTIGFSVKRLEDFYPIVRLITLTPKDLNVLNLTFLDYVIKGIDFIHKGSSIPQLTVPMIRDYEIPIPPLPEQRRIVSVLDECFAAIDKAIANAEQNLKNAKELFDSYLQGVFEQKGEGWYKKKLGEVCFFENGDRGKNYPNKSHRVAEGIPFINAGHLVNKEIDYSRMDYISEERFNLLGNGKVQQNDILFCLRGSLGKVANVGKLEKGAIASSLIILRAKEVLNYDFLLYFLTSDITTNQIFDFGNGAAQPNLSASSLKKFIIHIPKSKNEQRSIVHHLDTLKSETKKIEALYLNKIVALGELKKSIMQKTFQGELKIEKAIAV